MQKCPTFSAGIAIFFWFVGARVNAEFTTIYNVPPHDAPYSIGSHTQLNLVDGGYLREQFRAGNRYSPNTNVEVNITGGTVGYNFEANRGSTINVSGGYLQSGIDANGSTINISGGILSHGFEVADSSNMTISGGEFELDGQAISGLSQYGDTAHVNLPTDTTLTGVLSNGTPFVLTGLWDKFVDGTLRLSVTDLPPIGPANLTSSAGPVPAGIRSGQTLTVDSRIDRVQAGASSTVNVGPNGAVSIEAIDATVNVTGGVASGRAFANSVVNVLDGELGSFFSSHGNTIVNLYGGRIGYESQIFGGIMNIFGGLIDDNFAAYGVEVNFYGGRLYDEMRVHDGAVLNIAGGNMVNGGPMAEGGTVNLSRGTLGYLGASDGASVTISGGRILESLSARSNSTVTLVGDEFVLNGQLITGLDAVGQSRQIEVLDGSVISGVLDDGTPFSFSASDLTNTSYAARSDHLAEATVIVRRGTLLPIGVSHITASVDPIPAGIRRGQTLTVDSGSAVGDHFGAGFESVVIVEAGGVIGHDFEAAGAKVILTGGAIGYNLDVSNGSVVEVVGGEIGAVADVFGGGVVNLRQGSIGSNARIRVGGQLNVFGGRVGENLTVDGGITNIAGGSIGNDFTVYRGGIANIRAGTVDGVFTARDGTANISGGIFEREVAARDGSTVNVEGGLFKTAFTALEGSTVVISGGEFKKYFAIQKGSTAVIRGGNVDALATFDQLSKVELSGGVIGDGLVANTNSQVTLHGGDFRLNGQAIPELDAIGDSIQLNVPADFSLTGVLVDGTPFAFTSLDRDSFKSGTLRLTRAAVPPSIPRQISASTHDVPLGVRDGQVLIVDAAGVVPNNFMAGPGSMINVEPGGTIGANLEAIGATVNIHGGTVGANLDAFAGSVINVTAGTITGGMHIHSGGTLNIEAGIVGPQPVHAIPSGGAPIWVESGGVVNVSGGEVAPLRGRNGSRINIEGGRIGDFAQSLDGAEIIFSGGTIGDHFALGGDGTLTIIGDNFRVDGQPIGNQNSIGDSAQIQVNSLSSLTGVLRDGTPFALAHQDADYIFSAKLILQKAQLAPVGPASILASTDAVPYGIREAQHLIVDGGAKVGHSFNAGQGSTVDVLPGGNIDRNFEAIGATVNLNGGSIGHNFAGFADSVVSIRAGVLGTFSKAFFGSEINVMGGRLDSFFTAYSGSVANFFDGEVASNFSAVEGSVVNISGGNFGDDFKIFGGSECHLFGTAFTLGGVPISGLQIGVPVEIHQRDLVLSGVLANTDNFDFFLKSEYSFGGYDPYSSRDYFAPEALITVTLVHNPGDYSGDGYVDATDYWVWHAAMQTGDLAADGNYDRLVTDADRDIWQQRFGTRYFSIPELSTLGLVASLVLTCLTTGARSFRKFTRSH